jgi:hypothetical protein
MLGQLTAALVRPDGFFDRRQNAPSETQAENETDDGSPSLLYPVAIVAIVGLVGALGSIPVLLLVSSGLSQSVQLFFAVGAVIGFLFSIVGPFIAWLLYAIAFQVISYFLGGEGEFRETFVLSGWGFLPRILSSLLSVGATVVVFLSTSPDISPGAGPQATQAFSQQLQSDPMVQIASGIGIVLTLWSGYIWVFAVKHARDLSRNRAVVTVAIPLLVSIGISVGSLVLF